MEKYYDDVLLPDLPAGAQPALELVQGSIRSILEEEDLNRRISVWLDELKASARIVRMPLTESSIPF